MSVQRTGIRLSLTLAACALLGACAVEPVKPPPKPAVVIPRPTPAPPVVTPLPSPPATEDPWTSIVASFAMHDCADSSLIHAKERMYTRHPPRFEQLLQKSLPLMLYVHEQLQDAGIPGEFVMLPMLESSYQPSEPSRHGDAAGMWQLMPRTAHLRGVKVIHHYDGRRDPVASTEAAIAMLTNLHKRFDDWRVVDMAYNAGPWAVARALRKHPGLGDGAIPDIPVSATTRNHLAKLMALSCILREPARFHVQLPKPTHGDQLAVTRVPAGTHLRAAASMADISESELRALNPGYRGTSIPSDSPGQLLLPSNAADTLAAALTIKASESIAQVNTREPNAGPSNGVPLPAEPIPPDTANTPPPQHTRHRVRRGESLWSIAHHYHVSVRDLKRWNHLHDDVVQPGEILCIQG